jgi:hypothetical protein
MLITSVHLIKSLRPVTSGFSANVPGVPTVPQFKMMVPLMACMSSSLVPLFFNVPMLAPQNLTHPPGAPHRFCRMSQLFTQHFALVMMKLPSFILWRNTIISYPMMNVCVHFGLRAIWRTLLKRLVEIKVEWKL